MVSTWGFFWLDLYQGKQTCSQLEYHAHSFLLDVLKHVTSLVFQLGREKWGPSLAEEAE